MIRLFAYSKKSCDQGVVAYRPVAECGGGRSEGISKWFSVRISNKPDGVDTNLLEQNWWIRFLSSIATLLVKVKASMLPPEVPLPPSHRLTDNLQV